MLSIQYLNKRLKKKHIEKILSNYSIKYTTMKKEIENKVNVMIKTFTEDISAFLNNMEEIAEEKEKLKSLTNNQNELESLREEMKAKNHEESELRREIELLKIENNRLKNSTNNNTINNYSSRKKLYSSARENFNSMSAYNSPNIRSPKKGKNPNSLLLKTDRRENKKNLESKLFKSPQNTQLKKTTKKILQSKLEKKNTNLLKKTEKSKANKTVLGYNSADIKTEPSNNFNSNKGILSKNKQALNNTKKKTTFKLPPKNETQKKSENTKKILNRTVNNFNKIKDQSNTNTINKPDSISIKQDSEDSSSESSSYSKSLNKSRITSMSYEEENTIIDEEISEMNYFEEEITSLMDEIREFKKNNDEINNDKDTDKDKINEENKSIDNKSTEINNTENKNIENKNIEIKNTENKVVDNKEIKENKESNENKDDAKSKDEKKEVT